MSNSTSNNEIDSTTSANNLYAAPKSDVERKNITGAINFDGEYVIITSPTEFPAACVKCGKQGHKQFTKTMSWSNPWWALTILINFLIFIIIRLVVMKKLKISYFLCEEHLEKRTKKLKIFLSLFAAIILLGLSKFLIASNYGERPASIVLLAAGILFVIWFITFAILHGDFKIAKAVKKQSSEGRYYLFYLKGISQEFLKATKAVQTNHD